MPDAEGGWALGSVWLGYLLTTHTCIQAQLAKMAVMGRKLPIT